MNKKKLTAVLLVFILLLNVSISANAIVTAKSAVVMDQYSKRVLYTKNESEKLPFASTTKIMTAILTIEMCDLDEMVEVDDKAVGIEGSSIHLQKDEQMTVGALVYGLMLHSGNDAAVALAYHIAGGVDNFAALMNFKAKTIGAKNTNFANPNGLPNDNHYTTALDLAYISQYAMSNELFRQVVSTRGITFKTNGTGHDRKLVNKNKFLNLYEGANGIKTGYTKLAGRCFCGAAEKNGMQLIGVVLNSKDTYGDTQRMFDYCFGKYSYHTYFGKGDYIKSIPVAGSNKYLYRVYAPYDIKVPLAEGELDTTEIKYNLPKILTAPMKKGEKIGEIEIIFGDKSNIIIDITLQKDIQYKNNVFDYLINFFKE